MSRPRSRSTPFAILGLLGFEPMSGYDIRKEVAASIGYFWSESYGQIYPALRELSRDGLIRVKPGTPEGGRERRVYEITAKGRRALAAWREEPPRPAPVRNELLLKLFFGAPGGSGDEIAWLEALALKEAAQRREFRRIRRQLLEERRDHPSLPYWLAVVAYGEHHSRAALRWARETSSALRGLRAARKNREPSHE
ncbi:MAG TPA: PadR family transcriptional regulator [Candidatus Omnitrophota bacterium]|nr:PadR family transcriptional regulator [Candidatus Omnitrophota bacterium]